MVDTSIGGNAFLHFFQDKNNFQNLQLLLNFKT